MPHSAKNQDPQMAKEVKRIMYTFLINAIEICRDCLHNNYIDYIAQHFDCFNLRNSLLARDQGSTYGPDSTMYPTFLLCCQRVNISYYGTLSSRICREKKEPA